MKYYIDTDLRSGRIYVATMIVSKKHPWLIWCKTRPEAEDISRRLNAGLMKNPEEESFSYHLEEEIKEELGTISIYRYLGTE